MIHQARIRNHVLDDVRGRMSDSGCQTQDVRERIGNVRCDIAVSVERDETSSPLAKRLWKTSSLRIVIAIRPRQIKPFFFLNEEYKQSSLWAWLALGIMPTRGAIKRSLFEVLNRPSSSALVSIQPTSSRWFDVAWPVLFIYIARRYLQKRKSHKRHFAFPIYEYDFCLSDTRESVRVLIA